MYSHIRHTTRMYEYEYVRCTLLGRGLNVCSRLFLPRALFL